jgi:class 3 adenylate cyclase
LEPTGPEATSNLRRLEPSEVRYARSGNVSIAYQTLGAGPVDLILGFSSVSQLEIMWEEPSLVGEFRALAEFSRRILFDKRGVGLSDRDVGNATLEDRMDDIRAVLAAAGSARAVLYGTLDGAPLSILFAATYPEKTQALILWDGYARSVWAPDYPWAKTREEWEATIQRDETDWGSEAHIQRLIRVLAPSRLGDPAFARWLSRRVRFGASPSANAALTRMNMLIDVRSVLSAIQAPTLVMYTPESRVSAVEDSRFLAQHIPGAELVEIACPDHYFWTTPHGSTQAVDAMRRFVENLSETPGVERTLMTVLFTDIADSTRRAAQLGDRQWGKVLDRHFSAAASEVAHFRGSLIKTTGDGVLATFDGPTRAIRCALALRAHATAEGISIRAGLHTGECAVKRRDVEGIAIHIASRITDRANPGEILVSGTVRELSVGSEIPFHDRGVSKLKGLDGKWRLYLAGELPPIRKAPTGSRKDAKS